MKKYYEPDGKWRYIPGYEEPPIYLPPHRHHKQTNQASAAIALFLLVVFLGAVVFGFSLLRYGPSLFRAPVETNVNITINGEPQTPGETVTVNPAYQEPVQQTAQPPPAPAYQKYRAERIFNRNSEGQLVPTSDWTASDDWRILQCCDLLDVKDKDGLKTVDISYDPTRPTTEHTYVLYQGPTDKGDWAWYSEADSEAMFAADVDSGAIPIEKLSPQGLALYQAIKGGT